MAELEPASLDYSSVIRQSQVGVLASAERITVVGRWVVLAAAVILNHFGNQNSQASVVIVDTILFCWGIVNLVVSVLLVRGCQPGRGPVPVRPVVVSQDGQPHRHRVGAVGEQARHEHEVAQRLGHLRPVQTHHARVRVAAGEGPDAIALPRNPRNPRFPRTMAISRPTSPVREGHPRV